MYFFYLSNLFIFNTLYPLKSYPLQVTQKDIGIIAAFRSQILKIRLKLREVGLGNINVGSVQDYQGQEMKIIIISTVMTSRFWFFFFFNFTLYNFNVFIF